MLADETCWFLAADFDKKSWRDDVAAFLETCQIKNIPAAVERSRSGNGGHVWIFFSEPVPAGLARRLGLGMHHREGPGRGHEGAGRRAGRQRPRRRPRQGPPRPHPAGTGRTVLSDHAEHHCKPGTVVGYRYHLKIYINPRAGKLQVAAITRADIARLHHDLRFAPVQANRCLQLLSKMFNLAEVWGFAPTARTLAATSRSTRRRSGSVTCPSRNWPNSARCYGNAN